MKRRFVVLAVCAMEAACAFRTAPPLPVVSRVCVTAPQETPTETAYLRKKAQEYLTEYGFTLAETDCDATVAYQPMGNFQGERAALQLFWVSRSGYWSQEGMVSAGRPGGAKDLDDQGVALRGYSTKQELLGALAWEIVGPVTWLYRPPGKAL